MKRIKELNIGDSFIWFGRTYKIYKMKKDFKYCRIDNATRLYKFGANSSLKVQVV